jgi:hypothetical protein
VGVWGYSAIDKEYFDPDSTTDIMGYCRPQWISDYTYNALFKRLNQVEAVARAQVPTTSSDAGAAGFAPFRSAAIRDERGHAPIDEGRILRVDGQGVTRWSTASLANEAVSADTGSSENAASSIDLLDERGNAIAAVSARFVPYDHLPGGYLILPKTSVKFNAVRTHIEGRLHTLVR